LGDRCFSDRQAVHTVNYFAVHIAAEVQTKCICPYLHSFYTETMKQLSVPYVQIRGGSSKGLYFKASDLPSDDDKRDQLLLDAVGRDDRQIDGLGGADPLTSKVGIVSPSARDYADIDYTFVQVVVGENRVDSTPNCGNILAGVAIFAIEAGLFVCESDVTLIRVYMTNSGALCELEFATPNGELATDGDVEIDGVPGSSFPISCNYIDVAGGVCGALYPTGKLIDRVDDIAVTCVDNGMPVVVLNAADFGLNGEETPLELDANQGLKKGLESIRLQLGPKMNLGDVSAKAIPKMALVSPAKHGGLVHVHTFVPHKCHAAIGVLGALSVATACITQGTAVSKLVVATQVDHRQLSIEHPSGSLLLNLQTSGDAAQPCIEKAGVLRTARLLSKGELYVPQR